MTRNEIVQFLIEKGVSEAHSKEMVSQVFLFKVNHLFILWNGESFSTMTLKNLEIEDQEKYFKFRNEQRDKNDKLVEIYFNKTKLRSFSMIK